MMKTALCESAGHVLGYAWRKQPDWFRDSETELKPLFAERNRLHTLWLSTGLEIDRKKFARERSAAMRAVRLAKDAWFQRKAT